MALLGRALAVCASFTLPGVTRAIKGLWLEQCTSNEGRTKSEKRFVALLNTYMNIPVRALKKREIRTDARAMPIGLCWLSNLSQ